MSTYDPFTAARRYAEPPPCVVYAARCLEDGYFGRCDGCGWLGEWTATEPEAWTAAVEHMMTNDTEKSA